jgi:hypothetical protein
MDREDLEYLSAHEISLDSWIGPSNCVALLAPFLGSLDISTFLGTFFF